MMLCKQQAVGNITRVGGSIFVVWWRTVGTASRAGVSYVGERAADFRTRAGSGDVFVRAVGSGQGNKKVSVLSWRGWQAKDSAARADCRLWHNQGR